MIGRRGVAALAAALTFGCAARSNRVPDPGEAGDALIVLIADPNGTTGQAIVTSPHGQVELSAPGESTRVSRDKPPTAVDRLSKSDMRRIFGSALSALPPAPESFTLLFRFESELLTDESRATLRQVFDAVKRRPSPEVIVRGHTDTTGTAKRNFELGLKRAQLVRRLLIATGIDANSIEAMSHGEKEPLIPTADGTLEPRNRRVEITVR